MIQLVAIDFDDTLCMTEEICFHIENETAKKLGYSPMTREAHLKNWGKPLELAITERVPGIDVKKFMQEIEHIHQKYINQGKMDAITKENLQFLDDVKKSGRKLAIVTSRSLQEAQHLLHENHPLNSRIERFYHKDNSAFHKPDPRVFDQVLTDFSVKPENAIYIGDAVTDGISAKGAGLHFVALLESGLRTKEDFASIHVDFFATSLTEIFNYIENN